MRCETVPHRAALVDDWRARRKRWRNLLYGMIALGAVTAFVFAFWLHGG